MKASKGKIRLRRLLQLWDIDIDSGNIEWLILCTSFFFREWDDGETFWVVSLWYVLLGDILAWSMESTDYGWTIDKEITMLLCRTNSLLFLNFKGNELICIYTYNKWSDSIWSNDLQVWQRLGVVASTFVPRFDLYLVEQCVQWASLSSTMALP